MAPLHQGGANDGPADTQDGAVLYTPEQHHSILEQTAFAQIIHTEFERAIQTEPKAQTVADAVNREVVFS